MDEIPVDLVPIRRISPKKTTGDDAAATDNEEAEEGGEEVAAREWPCDAPDSIVH